MDLYDGLVSDGVDFEMSSAGTLFLYLHGEKGEVALRNLDVMREFGYELPTSAASGPALRSLDPAIGDGVESGFLLAGERAVQPASLVHGLADRLRRMDVEIREGTPVVDFRLTGDRVEAVRTTSDEQPCSAVVVAAGAWSTGLLKRLGMRLPMIAGKGYSGSVKPTTVPRTPAYLGEAKVGVTPFGSRLRVAGTMELSGLNTVFDQRRLKAVLRSATHYLAPWPADSVRDQWVGMRPLTSDGLPVLGPVPGWDNAHVATGHSMLGVTLGPATGQALAQTLLEGSVAATMRPFGADRFL
jgi:D-amino-acid dehydrogenase